MTSYIDEETWNDDILEDINPTGLNSLVVYSRDWTIETVVNQIQQGNIDINPKFQRRNAWKDDKRSRLIESLITGIPVPEIVLAEHPQLKRSFIVIDGKQRLLTIAGFMKPNEILYWNKPVLSKLDVRKDLNGISYDALQNDPAFINEYRAFLNADIRCTIISNYTTEDILYDIFYRLNTGSVPLSTQELRQVLNKGDFADYLMEITNQPQPVHGILGLDEPDPRLKDVEIVLRFIAFTLFGRDYKGNLKNFLDSSMKRITGEWEQYKSEVVKVYAQFNESVKLLERIMGANKVGRKYVNGKWEGSFNKALFEVEAFYFMFISRQVAERNKEKFINEFKSFCSTNTEFRESIEIATSNLDRYQTRYREFRKFFNQVFRKRIKETAVAL